MKIYSEYAKLKAQIAELTAKAKQMEIDIISELSEEEGRKYIADYATFSLISKKKYKYTDTLLEKEKLMKDQVKILKKKEELNGEAELLEDGYMLRCQLAK